MIHDRFLPLIALTTGALLAACSGATEAPAPPAEVPTDDPAAGRATDEPARPSVPRPAREEQPPPSDAPAPASGPTDAPLPATLPSDGPGARELDVTLRAGGWPLGDLVAPVQDAAGVRIDAQGGGPRVANARFGMVGVETVPPGEVLAWFQALLHQQRLSLLPAAGDGETNGWRVVDAAQLAPGGDPPAWNRVDPAHLPRLANRDGLFLETTFPLAEHVDPAQVRQAVSAFVSRAGAGSHLTVSGTGHALLAADFAPNLAVLRQVLIEIGALAGSHAEVAAPRLDRDAAAAVLTLPARREAFSIFELLTWAHEHTGAVFHFDPRSQSIRRGTVELVGDVVVSRDRALAWLRTVLEAQRLAVVPLGPARDGAVHRWLVADTAHPVAAARAVFVPETQVERLDRYSGAYVATVFHLGPSADPQRLRNLIAQMATKTAGLGSVNAAPGLPVLIVKDFARQAATMRKVLRDVGALADPSGGSQPALALPAHAATLDPPTRVEASTIHGLLTWAARELGMTFALGHDAGMRSAPALRFHGAAVPVRRAEVLRWLRGLLAANGRTLVQLLPVGSGAGEHPDDPFRQWAVLSRVHPLVSASPLFVPRADAAALSRHPGTYAVTVFEVAGGVDPDGVRAALAPLLTRRAALGKATALRNSGTLVVQDFTDVLRTARGVLGAGGLLVDAASHGADDGSLRQNDHGIPARGWVDARGQPWDVPALLDAVGTATGSAFVTHAQLAQVKAAQIEFTPPRDTGEGADLLHALQDALATQKLGLVPLALPSAGAGGGQWLVVSVLDPLHAEAAVGVAQEHLATLRERPGLYAVTAFPLAPDVDANGLRAQSARLLTRAGGLGSIHAVRGSPVLIARDFAPQLQEVRRALEDAGALRR